MAYRADDRRGFLSTPSLVLISVVTLLVMWLPSFWGIPVQTRIPIDWQGFLYASLQSGWDLTSTTACLVSLVLVVVCALAVYFVNRKVAFIRQESFFPSFLLLLFMGMAAQGHYLSPGICCLVVMTVALLLYLDLESFSVWTAYDIFFLLSLGSLFSVHLLWYAPFFWIGMAMAKQFSVRNLSASIIGLSTPYIIVAGVMFLLDDIDTFWNYLSNVVQSIGFYPDNDAALWGMVVLFGFVTVLALFSFIRQMNNDKIQARVSIRFLYLLFMVSCVLRYLYPAPAVQTAPVSSLFASIIFGHYFAFNKTLFHRILFGVLVFATLGLYLVYYIL